jgi:hypothetical protein
MRAPDDARARDQISRALAILDPPETEREKWAERIEAALALLRPDRHAFDDALHSKAGKAALRRHASALRATLASYGALDPSVRQFLSGLTRDELDLAAETSDVRIALRNVEKLLQYFSDRRPRQRPIDRTARAAAGLASNLLEMRGFKPTLAINGKWHRLSQVLANTDHDLRRHLTWLRRNADRHLLGAEAEKIVL